jgi:predicted kinase
MIVLVTGLQGTGKSTIADGLAAPLGAAVLSWDWFMAGLTPFASIQQEVERLDRATYRGLGWSLMWQIARSQLRRGAHVVLDGMVTGAEVDGSRRLAEEHGTELFLVLTTCRDETVHRALLENRRRDIPGWYELTWDRVQRARRLWRPPPDPHATVDACDDLRTNLAALLAQIANATKATTAEVGEA